MKYKKIILFLVFTSIFLFFSTVLAADNCPDGKICFTPSISIPGLYQAGQSFPVDGSSLAEYIKGVYRYGGIFSGIVAMFMLVYAGWQWLLAGGNSGKISQAKEKINGTLIGLVILFGGYLLLSLISKNLISFNSIDTKLADIPCALHKTEPTCPDTRCHWQADNFITTINEAACVDGTVNVKPACSIKKEATSCTALSGICKWESNKCIIQEKCSITQDDFTIFTNDTAADSSFNVHCCATDLFGGGFSNYRYAIFGNKNFKNSCVWICGGGSPERLLTECKASLGWDGAMDGNREW